MKILLASCTALLVTVGLQAAAQAQAVVTTDPAIMEHSTLLKGAEGQAIFDRDGNMLGTISSVDTDEAGQEGAVMVADRRLGMGTREVLIPSASLSIRPGGGYTTRLGHDAIESLPAFEHNSPNGVVQ